MNINVGDKVFFKLDDMTDVIDLTSGKEYEVEKVQFEMPTISDDAGYKRILSMKLPSAHLNDRATWQKVSEA